MLSGALLDMIPMGIIVLNHQAKLLYANSYAAELLRSGGDLEAPSGVLHARAVPHDRALFDAVRRLANRDACQPVAFSIARAGRRPISVLIVRLPANGNANATSQKSRIAVLLSDPDLTHRPELWLFGELFQFTPAECQIAMHMMEARNTAAIAKELSISPSTVRDHLKSMFLKTRTRNQGELRAILIRSPAGLHLPPQSDVAAITPINPH